MVPKSTLLKFSWNLFIRFFWYWQYSNRIEAFLREFLEKLFLCPKWGKLTSGVGRDGPLLLCTCLVLIDFIITFVSHGFICFFISAFFSPLTGTCCLLPPSSFWEKSHNFHWFFCGFLFFPTKLRYSVF